ncbi:MULTISPECIES: peptide synthetase [unclassified Caballeronia]|uniref:peptide synthetase n=1 Tax=unclassified Caballeronia TaxID=2646786 RepID=UPI0028666CA8|nr:MULTISPECIES: peptide synthetase [unclassified Caballeronia]MDR5776822.1 peptide synthetase [Caballeronia sp. LZ002]MDR5798681.1 peptide synthetase [Caballeronia sp. LZ001]MDR5852262.1 peptide synthetase [Caballeronia sp. LZ003]
MTHASSSLFDFSPFAGQSERYVDLIKQFAAAQPFRSAEVSELVLDDDYHRRPLRPEDFEFLKFAKPVRPHNVSRLPALASNRTLLSIYELGTARLPRNANEAEWNRFVQFYSDDAQVLGAQIAPFLEAYAFEFLSRDQTPSADAAGLARILEAESLFWDQTFARLMRNDYLEEGLRFIMVQRWSLAPSKQRALARAAASGLFDMLPVELRPALDNLPADAALHEKVAASCGVTRQQHAYWQFYLPTSMAKCNLLYALARRPDRAFGLVGAAFAAEAEALAFSLALERACAHLTSANRGAGGAADAQARQAELLERASHALQSIGTAYGASAQAMAAQGIGAAERLCERARWDLGEQLLWLSSIRHYVAFAHRISTRIDAECPDIDRETFIEPHEMCSTTHVHNDHRLVTIQEGEMLFWGNVGMQHKMNEGDMVLIPDGRLHGSTVVSGECTYHQPIIPDEWVQALVAELDAKAST